MKKNGEITAFLSLIFLLLLSFTGAVLESASIQVSKNEKRADMSRATESVFAEYKKELLEEYDIFAVDESYETSTASEENILNRLSYYGAENSETDIEKIQYLTDNHGRPFYEQAVKYESMKLGMDAARDLTGQINTWRENETDSEEYERENDETSTELDRLLQEEEQELPQENNPLQVVNEIRSESLLDLVLPEEFVLSNAAVDLAKFPSHRTLKKGRGEFASKELTALAPVFFNLYLKEKYDSAQMGVNTGADDTQGGLKYEMEYLIGGKAGDKENLESVVRKIIFMRIAPNYGYLLTDAKKQAEAEAMAAGLCTLILLPEIVGIVKHAILLAWAYGESVMDTRALLEGKKVPHVKSAETWKLSLTELLRLGEGSAVSDQSTIENGIGYSGYLQMLLLLEKQETLTMRALDLIELHLKVEKQMDTFRVDHCMTRIRFQTVCSLRRGIRYSFSNEYSYY